MTGLNTTSMTLAELREASVTGKSKTQKNESRPLHPMYGMVKMKMIDR